MSRTTRRVLISTTVVAAGILTLGACGSNDSDSGKAAASAKPTAEKKHDGPYLTGKVRMHLDDAVFATEPGTPEAVDIAAYADPEHQFKTDDDGFTWWQSVPDADANPKLVKVSQPDHGSAKVAGKTTISYTPTAGYVGDDTFTYTVKWHGMTKTGTVIVTVATPPDDSGSSSTSSSGGGGMHACVGSKHFKMCT